MDRVSNKLFVVLYSISFRFKIKFLKDQNLLKRVTRAIKLPGEICRELFYK